MQNSALNPSAGVEPMDHKTFLKFAELIYEKSGIKLGSHKEAMVHARIRKRMTKMGIPDFKAYYDYVQKDESGNEMVEMLNAISTNVTHFFRENRHFELLHEIISRWAREGQTRFRIWSAASSTGEEPYSLAITMHETLADLHDTKILATDLSTKVLRHAMAGHYEARHIENVPKNLLAKYFHRDGDFYVVNDDLRRMFTFARLNLAKPPFPMKGPFDVIFCRNVMIYFDNDVRMRLLENMYKLLKPGGYLMVGHAESLSGMLSQFQTLEPSVYTK